MPANGIYWNVIGYTVADVRDPCLPGCHFVGTGAPEEAGGTMSASPAFQPPSAWPSKPAAKS